MFVEQFNNRHYIIINKYIYCTSQTLIKLNVITNWLKSSASTKMRIYSNLNIQYYSNKHFHVKMQKEISNEQNMTTGVY